MTLEKIKRLERYLAIEGSTVDPVLDLAIDKLLAREISRMQELKARLSAQLATFEERYALTSADFYPRYEHSEMGDDMDFIEWAATVDMLGNVEKRLALLERVPDS
ncbi:MAG: hypothetical protein HY731_00785 [Candidatus Tectomicrobia bacterium]|nr:hypothetical protein [Candidatus Tectomicrobia bacterium]